MHPIHFWFLHDLRAYKKAMIALAISDSQAALVSKSLDATIGGYRPTETSLSLRGDFHTLAKTYLSASGYDWPCETPYKLLFLKDYWGYELTQKDVSRIQNISDFAFRLPQAIEKTRKACANPFWITLCICFSPLLVFVFAIAMCIKGFELSIPYLRKFMEFGLAKILPENLPESRVLGTDKSPKRLEA